MTASVLIHRPAHEDSTRQRSQSTDGPSTTGRRHGGWQDCGCRRTDCHDEFMALASTSDSRARIAARDQLIESHLELAYSIARHYHRPGPGSEDIRQVAALALVEAVNRFDPNLGTAFSAFAVPTIAGAIKRHFRDQRWTVHPPRRIKELRLRLRAATELLTQQMRRSPTVADLAGHLGCDQEEICEALCADDALQPLSIDAPVRAAEDDFTLAATLGGADDGYARVENLATLRPLLAELSERELRVITMRFAGNLTQSQIAERVGCSQMHVSRLLRAALGRMRRSLQDAPARPAGEAADHDPVRSPHDVPDEADIIPHVGDCDVVTTCCPDRPDKPVPAAPRDRPPRKTGGRARLVAALVQLPPPRSVPARPRPPNRPARVGTVRTAATRPTSPACWWPARRPYRSVGRPSRSPPT
jgi:RNA polymerase sigma-B factor